MLYIQIYIRQGIFVSTKIAIKPYKLVQNVNLILFFKIKKKLQIKAIF